MILFLGIYPEYMGIYVLSIYMKDLQKTSWKMYIIKNYLGLSKIWVSKLASNSFSMNFLKSSCIYECSHWNIFVDMKDQEKPKHQPTGKLVSQTAHSDK